MNNLFVNRNDVILPKILNFADNFFRKEFIKLKSFIQIKRVIEI